MTNTNESSMEKFMREKARQEHRKTVEDYAKKGWANGYHLGSYMTIMNTIAGGPKDAEEYTEICEDFINCTDANIRAHENIMFVDPVKYGINNEQYIRIFKTPLSREGRLFVLVKPVEHKLTKQTYFELAKIAVCAEHYLAHKSVDDTRGEVYARQMALVDPKFLEPGKYKEICRLAARTNYRALKWMQYDVLGEQNFIDVFMATATHWHHKECWGENPALHYLMDSDVQDWLRKECSVAYAEKYGIEGLQHHYESFTRGTNVLATEVDHGMLNDVRDSLGFRKEAQPQSRKFNFVRFDDPASFDICCDCAAGLETCPVYKQARPLSCDIANWNHAAFDDNRHMQAQNRVDITLANKTDMDALKRKLNDACKTCKLGHNR